MKQVHLLPVDYVVHWSLGLEIVVVYYVEGDIVVDCTGMADIVVENIVVVHTVVVDIVV